MWTFIVVTKVFRRWKTTFKVIVLFSIVFAIYHLCSARIWSLSDMNVNIVQLDSFLSEDIGVNSSLENNNSIFFHETSTRGFLNAREACAVESAARTHPKWEINVLFTSVINATFAKTINNTFKGLNNIKMRRIDLAEYARDTPALSVIKDGRLKKSRWRVSHTSDVLRYITLYRSAGIYLDLDVIVAKSLSGLSKNWAVWESKNTVAAGALAFSEDEIGRTFANATIIELARTFTGKKWGNNGPGVITRVLKKFCSTKNILEMSARTCSGFEVYGAEYFYPVKWQQAKKYFQANKKVPEAYGYHVWNQVSHKLKIQKNSPYDKLARKFCPNVYNSGTLK